MKPVVTFERIAFGRIDVGGTAYLENLEGHPSMAAGEMRGELVRTSMVQSIHRFDEKTGEPTEFETENTIYRKRA